MAALGGWGRGVGRGVRGGRGKGIIRSIIGGGLDYFEWGLDLNGINGVNGPAKEK